MTPRTGESTVRVTPESTRVELVRALGAAIITPPPGNAGLRRALDLPPESAAEHTDAFVLGLPPFAAIYLGAQGQLGGEAQDRVAGFWRALGVDPAAEPDHLGVLLLGYAELAAATETADPTRQAQLAHVRDTLLYEHLLSWVPVYLSALERLDVAAATAWAQLARTVLDAARPTDTRDAAHNGVAALPAALREAPPPVDPCSRDALLDSILVPVRSGMVLSQRDLAASAGHLGAGLRRGERRFALRALLEQQPRDTIAWLRDAAGGWVARHRSAYPAGSAVGEWWAARAAATVEVLTTALEQPVDLD